MQNPVPDAPAGRSVRQPDAAPAGEAARPDARQLPHPPASADASAHADADTDTRTSAVPVEIDGPSGPEPTRYGDWERKGRCIDF